MSLLDEVRSDDRRRALVALRDELAAALEMAEPPVKAQLAGQLRAVLTELAGLPTGAGVPKRDELKERREVKRSGKSGGAASKTVKPAVGKGR